MDEKVSHYVEQNRDRFLSELQEFLRFASVSAQPAHRPDMRSCAQWLIDHFRSIGLEASLVEGDGHPIVRARAAGRSDRRLIIYGHYDVQPVDPLDEWLTPPFEPTVRDGQLWARGATDDKGQVFAHVKALEAILNTAGAPAGEVLFLLEGEEECGGTVLPHYLEREKDQLAAGTAGVVVSDSEMVDENTPAITYALRGTAAMELTVQGPRRDLHSGTYGGAVGNPAAALAWMLSQCLNPAGEITIDGFHDGVRPLADWEKENFAQLGHQDEAFRQEAGVSALLGPDEATTLEKVWARPTFEINGIYGGYLGQGGKTIIPASATAKITMRLVPDQDPQKVIQTVKRHLQAVCPDFARLTIRDAFATPAVCFDIDSPLIRSGRRALEQGFGSEPRFIRCGGSIPVVETFARCLKAPVLLMGFGLTSNGAHSPNEHFALKSFYQAIRASACLALDASAYQGTS
ncbi:MAG: dipeptidase [Sedimentisphaerales bacterium]|nr:dipeptidase [Sedimentisphaerales bacterium]